MQSRPFSPEFQEHYWSSAGGVEEKNYVFLQGNMLPERLAHSHNFTVAELGFGTGLTFLLTVELFSRVGMPNAHLTYIAYEKFPPTDLALIHTEFPTSVQSFSAQLLREWPPQSGWNQLHLGAITLHLFIGDAEHGLSTHPFPADAWFLDGFSPAQNPEMWTPDLLATVAAKTSPKGTFSTYTVARAVRESLSSAGFRVEKKEGLPPKRHMLTGTLI